MGYREDTIALGPFAYWYLDETSGTAADDSINNMEGTYNGSPTLGNTGAGSTTGTSVFFDGTDDYVSAVKSVSDVAPDATMMAFVKLSSLPTSGNKMGIMGFDDDAAGFYNCYGRVYIWNDAGTMKLVMEHANSATRKRLTYNVPTWTTGEWYHVAAQFGTQAGAQSKLFIDQVEVASLAGGVSRSDTNSFLIGAMKDGASIGSYFNGYIDEPAYFSSHVAPPAADPAPVSGGDPATGAEYGTVYPAPEALPHKIGIEDLRGLPPEVARPLARKLQENFEVIERQLLALDPEQGDSASPYR